MQAAEMTGEATGETHVFSGCSSVTAEADTDRRSAGQTGWTTDSISFQEEAKLSTAGQPKGSVAISYQR